MGVIKKQSIAGSIYSYLGVALGFVTTGLLFPRVLSTEEVGLLRVMVSYSTLFAQFAGLGFTMVAIRFFPYFRTKDGRHHGFLGLFLLVALVGFILSLSIYLLLRNNILENAEQKSQLFVTYYNYVIPLIFFTLLFNVFDTYYRVLYNAVKGILVKEVFQRLAVLTVILLYYFSILSFHQTVILYVLALVSPSVTLFVSLLREKKLSVKPDFDFIDKKLFRNMLSVGFFGMLSSFSGMLVMNIDILMVDYYLGLGAAGIYTVTFFFGALILVPMRTMGKIGSIVVADAWKNNDWKTIDDIYKKSSLSLSVVGLLLFIGIWGNVDNIFVILRDDYLPGKMVILFIGLANLTDIATGINGQILVNSKHYRFLSYFLFGFALLLVASNYLLIPLYGIVGAALASLFSKVIFNLTKVLFLWKRFKLQPFRKKHLVLIAIGLLTYFTSTLLPTLPNFWVDIIIRSLLITTVYALPVYYFEISPDINQKVRSVLGIGRKPE